MTLLPKSVINNNMSVLLKLLVSVFSLLVVDYLIPGFELQDFWTAVVAAVVIGVVNTFIKPVLQIVALPISIVTLGLSAFLINVLLLWGTSSFVPGFYIADFWTAVLASILLSLVTWFLYKLARE